MRWRILPRSINSKIATSCAIEEVPEHRRCAMIVGSGLIARAFGRLASALPAHVQVYAAGVSNSSCRDEREFARERERLSAFVDSLDATALMLYFSTCSVDDPDSQRSAYVAHKRAMENFVRDSRRRHLILRLPQLAGVTPNPHTLLNYLHARIVRSERFEIWARATRNIIDVDDVARIALDLLENESAENETLNIANTHNAALPDIVHAMELAVERNAIFDAVDRGGSYAIDTQRIRAALQRTGIAFAPDYLRKTVEKYYGRHVQHAS
jgi:NAD dependent epimerase/dehydratase family